MSERIERLVSFTLADPGWRLLGYSEPDSECDLESVTAEDLLWEDRIVGWAIVEIWDKDDYEHAPESDWDEHRWQVIRAVTRDGGSLDWSDTLDSMALALLAPDETKDERMEYLLKSAISRIQGERNSRARDRELWDKASKDAREGQMRHDGLQSWEINKYGQYFSEALKLK